MQEKQIKKILEDVSLGKTSIDNAMKNFSELHFSEIDIAMLDNHRSIRTGQPEVIYGEGKSIQMLAKIISHMIEKKENIFATRVNKEKAEKLLPLSNDLVYNEEARTIKAEFNPLPRVGSVAVVAAGTSDIPVVEEIIETLLILGNNYTKIVDVGVAGIHRLFSKIELIREANAVIVVAGMEGALASVVGGLVKSPVVAVPTSVGYGASFHGVTALLSMLNSCTPNVTVVNIDNGFGAAYFASIINHI